MEVQVNDGEGVDRALKLLRRKLQRAGLFKELRRRRYYLKPSVARQLKTAAVQRRGRRKQWDRLA